MKDLQTDASQHIAAIARWDNEGGACNVLSKKTDAELKKRPRSKRNLNSSTKGSTADAHYRLNAACNTVNWEQDLSVLESKERNRWYAICVPKEERAMTDTTYVQQLRKTISGEFYFGAMCRETKRRIAISTDTSRGKQRYSQSGETIVSCNHCHKTHRFDNRDIFSFPQVGWEWTVLFCRCQEKMMASDDKKIKTNSAPENEAPPEKKSTSGAEPSKADGGELAAASPSGYSRGEGQKPVSKAYRDNWNVIFAKKKKR
jgi:hypothetical protein